uniref:Intraflagellar transport protein 46 homolog n=1 Tax=Aquila chrysaetos chrysaetos TaxID=223781 RepID=A0A663ECH5_AQUCH
GSRRPGLPGAGGGAADRSSDEEGSGGKEEAAARSGPAAALSEDEDDSEEEEEDSSETDSEDDSEEHGAALEGDFNLADYDYLPVSSEIKELFEYIKRYTPKTIEIEHKLQPFIPDFIPAVGDIDAFLKVPRPDGKPDNLGLLVLDEPSTKQSDPTVLSLWLTENSKQHNITQQIKVKSLENAEKNPKAIDSWIESISELHRCKPPATVHYTRPMPDIETLMQEWSPEFEELLGKVGLPTAEMNCDLAEYVDMICAILDIPVYKSRIQPLHVLFSLYSEFKNSQVCSSRQALLTWLEALQSSSYIWLPCAVGVCKGLVGHDKWVQRKFSKLFLSLVTSTLHKEPLMCCKAHSIKFSSPA